MGFRVESIVAFLSVGKDGEEGVIALGSIAGPLPAICADPTREKIIEAMVKRSIKGQGIRVRKVRFTTRVEEGEVTP